eukprot:2308367-Pleurochrysis_carterae.AAC.5
MDMSDRDPEFLAAGEPWSGIALCGHLFGLVLHSVCGAMVGVCHRRQSTLLGGHAWLSDTLLRLLPDACLRRSVCSCAGCLFVAGSMASTAVASASAAARLFMSGLPSLAPPTCA